MKKFRPVASMLSCVSLLYSLLVAYWGWGSGLPKQGPWPLIKVEQLIILVLWSLLPPIWFWFEYFLLYLKPYKKDSPLPFDFELFKYGQDVTSKIWLSVSSVLFVLYFGKDIKL